MALSIKTEEADRLARELSQLTGESMTEAVTKSLKERLVRERDMRRRRKGYVARIMKRVEEMQKNYDLSVPVTKAEIDAMWSDGE
jgi:antitoxin VapB